MQNTGGSEAKCSGGLTVLQLATGFRANQLDVLVVYERMEHADGIGATTHTRHHRVRKTPGLLYIEITVQKLVHLVV